MRYLTLLPLLALLACDDSSTSPVDTPDPFWSGTKPAVRVTVLNGTKEKPALDRVGRVRIDVLWDSAWTPGATDRRMVIFGGGDSTMSGATGARWYFTGTGAGFYDSARSTNPVTSAADFPLQGTRLTTEQDVRIPAGQTYASVEVRLYQDRRFDGWGVTVNSVLISTDSLAGFAGTRVWAVAK